MEFYTKYFHFTDEVPEKKLTEILGRYKTPGFHIIVGHRSGLLGLLANCSAIVAIIDSDYQRSQAKIDGIETESISAILTIVKDRQRSQRFNGKHQCSNCSDRNDYSDPSDHTEIKAQRLQGW